MLCNFVGQGGAMSEIKDLYGQLLELTAGYQDIDVGAMRADAKRRGIDPEFMNWLVDRLEHYKDEMVVTRRSLLDMKPWDIVEGVLLNMARAFFQIWGIEVYLRSKGQRFTQPIISYPEPGVEVLVHAVKDDRYLLRLRQAPGGSDSRSKLGFVPGLTASASHLKGLDAAKHPARAHLIELALQKFSELPNDRIPAWFFMPKDQARYDNSYNFVVPLRVCNKSSVPEIDDPDELWLSPAEVLFCARWCLLDQHAYEAFGALRIVEDVLLRVHP